MYICIYACHNYLSALYSHVFDLLISTVYIDVYTSYQHCIHGCLCYMYLHVSALSLLAWMTALLIGSVGCLHHLSALDTWMAALLISTKYTS